jgi:hypothetical protein
MAGKLAPELRRKSRIDAVVEAPAQFDPGAAGEYRSAAAAIKARNPRLGRKRAARYS